MMECRLTVIGNGWVALGITDGQEHLIAELPVRGGQATLRTVKGWSDAGTLQTLATAQDVQLEAGKSHRVELAFVDRRVTLALDGTAVFPPVDLPAADKRPGVVRPVLLGAKGAAVVVRNFRLFRDVHYTDRGSNGVGGKAVRLGTEQYFVLGDNSPLSQDSRFWADGAVPERNILGRPFAVYLPGSRSHGGPEDVSQTDWSRVRWIP
jgi:signal peptidase I